jgi:hypothetical protein
MDADDRGDCGWGDGPGGGTFAGAEALRCAQNLAQNCGFAVLPVREDKRPACPRGFHAASKGPGAIAELWQRWPAPLVGIATGGTSDLAALDVDLKHPEAVLWWRANEKRLPETRAYRTRSGGVHVFFRHAPGVRCSTGRPVPGVDIRGEGGYIIHWFSSGYSALDDAPRAPWPAWLSREIWPPAPPVPPEQGRPAAANEAGIAAVVSKVARASEGNRNGILYWGAKRLAEKRLSAREIETLLAPAAISAGLSELEARRTIASAGGR